LALKNVGASVRARLLRMAQERHDSFEGHLVRYVHERLLYRLGRSEHATRFALKGALLFPLWGQEVVIAEKLQGGQPPPITGFRDLRRVPSAPGRCRKLG
jgi:hypothetical protein